MDKRNLARFIIASSIALTLPLAAQARPMGPMGDGPGGRGDCMQMQGGGMMGGGMMDGRGMMRMLRGLDLTEAQRDQVFEIMHKQAPALRAKVKEARQARIDLRTLATSAQYDEAKAKTLADAGAKATSELAQMHARTHNQIFKLLTPEQQEKFKQIQAQRQSRFQRDVPAQPAPN